MRLPAEFVTGAGTGLGRAISVELARRGGRIVDVARDGAEHTAELVRAQGGTADDVVPCAVTADDVAPCAVDHLEHGALHVLPMREARAAWLAKRALPGSFHRITHWARRGLDRLPKVRP